MLSDKLKQFRLAKGYSLDDLVSKTGNLISKVALSKYERGLMNPSPRILAVLANVFETKVVYLTGESKFHIELIAYRKGSALRVKEMLRVENLIKSELEERVRLQVLISPSLISDLPLKEYSVKSLEDVEKAAIDLRQKWVIGLDPIPNLVNLLENHFIHVFMIEAPNKFDGISALCKDSDGLLKSAAVVSRQLPCGERQRFNLAHELAHLVLNIYPSINEESVAHRFAGAFLAPASEVIKRVGASRSQFQLKELLLYKKHFGISIQALLFRFKDLGIINQAYFTYWFKLINRCGYKFNEPEPLPVENPSLWEGSVLYAVSENLISIKEAEKLLKKPIEHDPPLYITKQEFLKLPLDERRRILSEQAEKMKSYYLENQEWKDTSLGEIYEY